MPAVVIVGCQIGDEGKGKIVDFLAKESDMVVRFQGGANAGHTIEHDKKYKLHLVPSGVLRGITCILANGVVIDARQLISEIEELERGGVDCSNVVISSKAHLILPAHITMDSNSELRRGNNKIGTTGKGIGPAYRDKAARSGIRLEHGRLSREKLRKLVDLHLIESGLSHMIADSAECLVDEIKEVWSLLKDRVIQSSFIINNALDKNDKVLFEGAQGILLDIDHGTYPFVTSSNTCAGAVCTGAGVGPTKIDSVLGVTKAYTTRVGAGPFPTKLEDENGELLRKAGNEYGTTTGRPRDCGWLDLVALEYAAQVNGMTHLAITKLDVLDKLDVIKACYQYVMPNKGSVTSFPTDVETLDVVKPLYMAFDGWQEPTSGIRKWENLPLNARIFLEKISDFIGVPITLVSTGSNRKDTIVKRNVWKG